MAAALRCKSCNELHYLNDDQLCLDCSPAQEAKVPKPKPVYSMEPEARRRHVHSFAGKRVTIVVSPFRTRVSERNETVTGVCLGVGIANNGTAADQLVLDPGQRFYLRCLSLATILSIEVAGG